MSIDDGRGRGRPPPRPDEWSSWEGITEAHAESRLVRSRVGDVRWVLCPLASPPARMVCAMQGGVGEAVLKWQAVRRNDVQPELRNPGLDECQRLY